MYKAKKKLREIDLGLIFGGAVHQLFINENLTTKRRKLLGKARQLKREKLLKYVWTNDGKIFVKKDDGSKTTLIRNEDSLGRFG